MNVTPSDILPWDHPQYIEEHGKELVVYHVMTKTWQAGSLLTVGAYGFYALFKRMPLATFVRGPIWAVPILCSIGGYPVAQSRMQQNPVR